MTTDFLNAFGNKFSESFEKILCLDLYSYDLTKEIVGRAGVLQCDTEIELIIDEVGDLKDYGILYFVCIVEMPRATLLIKSIHTTSLILQFGYNLSLLSNYVQDAIYIDCLDKRFSGEFVSSLIYLRPKIKLSSPLDLSEIYTDVCISVESNLGFYTLNYNLNYLDTLRIKDCILVLDTYCLVQSEKPLLHDIISKFKKLVNARLQIVQRTYDIKDNYIWELNKLSQDKYDLFNDKYKNRKVLLELL